MYGQKYLRGQVWWVGGKEEKVLIGNSVQTKNRPHLIVSNNVGNRNSSTLIAIPFTTEEKNDLPTHYTCEFNGKKNTLLAEQIRTINIDELMSYMFMLDDKTMYEIDKVIKISLGLIDDEAIEMIRKINKDKNTYIEKDDIQEDKNINNFLEKRITFETNKRGRIWNNETKQKFVDYVQEHGLEEASKKYNTKNNTQAYYTRFCNTLYINNSEVTK